MEKERTPGEGCDIEDFTISNPNAVVEVEKKESKDDERVKKFMATLLGIGSYIPGDDDLF